jgi:hypothetical protein
MPRPLPHILGQLTRNPLFQIDKINIRTRNQGKWPKNDGQLNRQESKEPDYAGDHGVSLSFTKTPRQLTARGNISCSVNRLIRRFFRLAPNPVHNQPVIIRTDRHSGPVQHIARQQQFRQRVLQRLLDHPF